MKQIKIVDQGYSGRIERSRTACRGIILREGKLLLSYEAKHDQWMLPGGGLEPGETSEECCVREIAEESGCMIRLTSGCLLEIEEYYENWRWVNRYYLGECVGSCERSLTEREKEAGLVPNWLPLSEAAAIFSAGRQYTGHMAWKAGLYLREHTALTELRSFLPG